MSRIHPTRINLELGPKSIRALDRLQVGMEASSRVEVIRFALQTMAKIAKEAQLGSRLVIERADGSKVEILIPPFTEK